MRACYTRFVIKAIIFDCFGVLTTDVWMEYVLTLPKEVQGRIHKINHDRGSGNLSQESFIEALVHATGKSNVEMSLASTPGGNKNKVLLEYIQELRLSNYKIGLLSNIGSNWIREEFLTRDEQALFDEYILSYEVNLIKPDPQIFKLVCMRMGVEPNECVMIDDIKSYCDGAKSIGMHTIVYHDFLQMNQELDAILSNS